MGRLGIVCWEEEKKKERAMDGEWFSVACRILKKVLLSTALRYLYIGLEKKEILYQNPLFIICECNT